MLTPEQIAALKLLDKALRVASESGLFDTSEAWDCIKPDVINQFCDGVILMVAEE